MCIGERGSADGSRLPATMITAVAIAIAGRFLLSFTPLYESLKHDQLLSSPLTSYSRLQEGIFLNRHGVNPYSGGGFYHSPLLLSLFSTVVPPSTASSCILWAICDIISAFLLLQIWRCRSGISSSQREMTILGAFLLNPYLFLSSLALSTSTLEITLYLASVYLACKKKKSACLVMLAFMTHLSLPYLLLAPPLILLLLGNPTSSLASPKPVHVDLKFKIYLGEFSVYLLMFFFVSSLASGDFSWITRTWGTALTLPDLTPNPGLWWYFFTEMFDHFRPFFLMVFSVHMIIYVAPICIKFQHDPLFATFLLQGILAMLKPYPTMSDMGLFLSCTSLFPEIYSHLRHPIVTALLHLHASLLLPLLHDLWLARGTGNANFFYASTLVYGMANGAAIVDCIYAGLRIALHGKKGHALVQK